MSSGLMEAPSVSFSVLWGFWPAAKCGDGGNSILQGPFQTYQSLKGFYGEYSSDLVREVGLVHLLDEVRWAEEQPPQLLLDCVVGYVSPLVHDQHPVPLGSEHFTRNQ